jgi:hypothetical protein
VVVVDKTFADLVVMASLEAPRPSEVVDRKAVVRSCLL